MTSHFVLPEPGSFVAGRHILGANYSGRIGARRFHTINPDLVEFSIGFPETLLVGRTFDARLGRAVDDLRSSILVTVSINRSAGSRCVGSGGDDWFEVTSEPPSPCRPVQCDIPSASATGGNLTPA